MLVRLRPASVRERPLNACVGLALMASMKVWLQKQSFVGYMTDSAQERTLRIGKRWIHCKLQ